MKNRIEKIASAVGKSINQISLEIGFTKGYLSRVISGERIFNDRLVHLLCTTYNISESWLRNGDGEMFVQTEPEPETEIAMRVIADRVKRLDPDLQAEVYELCRRILDSAEQNAPAKPPKNTSKKKEVQRIKISGTIKMMVMR